jgi:hypothetical protein
MAVSVRYIVTDVDAAITILHRYAQLHGRHAAGARLMAHTQDRQRGMADMQTAEQSAALAADAQRLEDVRVNLQQVLNCLVGRKGPEYRRSASDPCSVPASCGSCPRVR